LKEKGGAYFRELLWTKMLPFVHLMTCETDEETRADGILMVYRQNAHTHTPMAKYIVAY